MNNLLKDCTFDFSKAGSALKMSVLAVVTTVGVSMSNPVMAHGDHNPTLFQPEIATSISHNANPLQDLVDVYKPNLGGKQILDEMERRGIVKTPLTLADYKDIVEETFDSKPTILIRSPISEDSLLSIVIATKYEKENS